MLASIQENLNKSNSLKETPKESGKEDRVLQDAKNEDYGLLDESKLAKTETSEDLEIHKEAGLTENSEGEGSSAKENTSVQQDNVAKQSC